MRTKQAMVLPDAAVDRVIGQLRHAYALMMSATGDWTSVQRSRMATGLIGPQIKQLEALARDFARQERDLAAAFEANAKHRSRYRDVEQTLLAHAQEIGSASQARRIITMAFRRGEQDTFTKEER